MPAVTVWERRPRLLKAAAAQPDPCRRCEKDIRSDTATLPDIRADKAFRFSRYKLLGVSLLRALSLRQDNRGTAECWRHADLEPGRAGSNGDRAAGRNPNCRTEHHVTEVVLVR